MNKTINPIRWNIYDLDALPENEGICREIIDGELFVTRAPHWKHQQIIARLTKALENWSEQYEDGNTLPSPGIVPSPEDSVIPDLVWVSNERLAAIEDEAGHFADFPELVVEVLSAGERNIYRDKQAKLKLYSQGGVQEYWIVDRFLNGASAPASLRDFEAEASVSLMGAKCGLSVKPPRPRVTEGNPLGHRFNQQLEVYRQEQGQLALVETLAKTDHLTSPLFTNFSLSISQIFA